MNRGGISGTTLVTLPDVANLSTPLPFGGFHLFPFDKENNSFLYMESKSGQGKSMSSRVVSLVLGAGPYVLST